MKILLCLRPRFNKIYLSWNNSTACGNRDPWPLYGAELQAVGDTIAAWLIHWPVTGMDKTNSRRFALSASQEQTVLRRKFLVREQGQYKQQACNQTQASCQID